MAKNIKEQKAKTFGTKSQPAPGAMRDKHMEVLKDFIQRRYGLELTPSGGKWDEETQSRRNANPKIGVDNPDWRSGKFEAQESPDAVVHEQAHLEMMPEGIGLAEGQRYMDQQYADVQRKHGYLQQKRSSGEAVPMAAENPIRRGAGLPAVHRDVPVAKDTPERRTVDTDEPAATRLQIGDKFVDQLASSRLMRPEARERMDMIDRGEIRYSPETGWQPGEDINSKINQRARFASYDDSRKDAKTLMRNDLDKADKKDQYGLSTNSSRKIRYANEAGINKPFAMGSGDVGVSNQGYTVRGAMNAPVFGNPSFRQPQGGPKFDRDVARDKAKKVLSEMRSTPKPNLPKSEEAQDKRNYKFRMDEFERRPRGVHSPTKEPGQSVSGKMARRAKQSPNDPSYSKWAKQGHQEKLDQLKSMSKPNLPKSEDGMRKDERGVHKQSVESKVAESRNLKNWKGMSDSGRELEFSFRPRIDEVKNRHKQVLSDLKSMPKPNLPKSEDMQKADQPQKQKHLIFSTDNPLYGEHNDQYHDAMKKILDNNGVIYHEAEGHYGAPERSFIVENVPDHVHRAIENILQNQGQESYIVSNGVNHKMKFINGENKGKHVRGSGTVYHEKAPETGYTKLGDEMFTHNFDFNKLHD